MKDLISPHTRGESIYVDDIPEPVNLLQAIVFTSNIPHGKIISLDITKAENSDGVCKVLIAKDIPGDNQIGRLIQDEELLAEKEVHFIGQPIAVVLAETKEQAKQAMKLINIEYEELPTVFDSREAARKGLLISSSRTLTIGDIESTWGKCATVIEGIAESGGQEHVYLETQASLAIPDENGRIIIYSSTQAPTTVQGTTSKILGCDMNLIEVDVKRLGGAFGGKEDQATPWAAICALGVYHTDRPVKLVLTRREDIIMTGKRHPYSTDYKIGLDEEGKILAFSAEFYQNSGAAADLSTAILGRTLFHATNAYYVPNVRVTGYPCKTNIVPFTAFRGFGGPQGMFVIECAIAHAAEITGIPVSVLQEKNLLQEGDQFHYGQQVENCNAKRSFSQVVKDTNFEQRKKEIEDFNTNNRFTKKGISLMPICFGISFTSSFLNQAGALVNVYKDGSVSISTGAIDMGQGVNIKIRQIAAKTLSIKPERIRIES
ncbi:MAG: molybdopterin-dependent oxidoreductase, partial [Candidatus Heimdallarchaeota archaeon]|nr:molybdopterin-dependent oxidoreductase [Candidatus Heimdallarchaeota archaeon]MCK5144733.1 molybdopterin-dependent oxidoreductase [Candidatus Heimdallarchaeota archaeon]